MTWFPENISWDVLTSVTLLRKRLKENRDLFNDPDCKYDQKVKDWFLNETATPVGSIEEIEAAAGGIQNLETETQLLFIQLKHLRNTKAEAFSSDPKEELNYIKVANQLLERLLECQERAANVKEIETFKTVVIETLNDLLSPEGRTEFMERLKAAE